MPLSSRILKRSFDLLAAFAGCCLLWPVALVVGLVVAATSPGPVLYRQKRIGRHGGIITCLKFRTMRCGAESGGSVTTSVDDRVTPVGRFLRRFKLDELPQLVNVLRGEMSFVGPRPDVPGYADLLEGDARRILELRPGITGPATIYFRYEEELLAQANDPKRYNDEVIWPKKVELNLAYLRRWGFWKDVGFVLITVIPALNAVFRLVPPSPLRRAGEHKNVRA